MENFIDNESFIVKGNWLSILKLKSSQKQKRSCEEWLADVYRQDKIKTKRCALFKYVCILRK